MLKTSDKFIRLISILIILFVLFGCQKKEEEANKAQGGILRLAATSTTADSGLLDVLIPVFEEKHKINVEIIPKGTGAALQASREGKADVVLVHSRVAENKFVLEGYGINRLDVMYNDFVVLGQSNDPLQIMNEKDILSILKKISDQKQAFISRGDNSGTHTREKELWKLVQIEPKGDWYKESKKGMLDSLKIASNIEAYILCDRSTYLHNKNDLNLVILFEGDKRLTNPYGIIAVNPVTVPGVNFNAAMKFINFVVSTEGQEIIADYGKEKFGQPLFFPLAK